MPGDMWQKLANLRLLLTYQFMRPGKQLVFMGTELAQHAEWNHDRSLDWHLLDDPRRQALQRFLVELGSFYRSTPALWRGDPDIGSFEWLDCSDRDNSVVSFVRRWEHEEVVVVMNFTPVPREDYRIGVPSAGTYRERLSSDNKRFGGSDFGTLADLAADPIAVHGREQSVNLRLPPLGALILVPAKR
jgi:1,4-alpha-glucan branching enzyme